MFFAVHDSADGADVLISIENIAGIVSSKNPQYRREGKSIESSMGDGPISYTQVQVRYSDRTPTISVDIEDEMIAKRLISALVPLNQRKSW